MLPEPLNSTKGGGLREIKRCIHPSQEKQHPSIGLICQLPPTKVHPNMMSAVICKKVLNGSVLTPFLGLQLNVTADWQEVRIITDHCRVPTVFVHDCLCVYHTTLSHDGCFFKCLSLPDTETKLHGQATQSPTPSTVLGHSRDAQNQSPPWLYRTG